MPTTHWAGSTSPWQGAGIRAHTHRFCMQAKSSCVMSFVLAPAPSPPATAMRAGTSKTAAAESLALTLLLKANAVNETQRKRRV